MRGQIGAEYIFLVALVFVMVATSILQGFRDTEINLGLSGARLACQEMASNDSNYSCYVLGYSIDDTARQVNVTPQMSYAYAEPASVLFKNSIKRVLVNHTLYRWTQIFRPDSVPDYAQNCTQAAYYKYCMVT